jgi:hypothetical protein
MQRKRTIPLSLHFAILSEAPPYLELDLCSQTGRPKVPMFKKKEEITLSSSKSSPLKSAICNENKPHSFVAFRIFKRDLLISFRLVLLGKEKEEATLNLR